MLSAEIQELVDRKLSGTDILHGYMKNAMYETEKVLVPLLENSEELGSDEDYSDTVDRLYHEGYMDALVSVNSLIVDLTYALEERARG